MATDFNSALGLHPGDEPGTLILAQAASHSTPDSTPPLTGSTPVV